MRHFFYLFLLIGTLSAAEVVNVRDFGAKGDGKTDDTEAIQKAADAAANKLSSSGTGTLYLPPGRYKLSKRIELEKIHVKGDSVVLAQSNPKEDIFYYKFAWNTRVTGIEFHGGRDQLSFWNTNTDKGMLIVRDCRFFRSNNIAVGSRLGSNSSLFSISNCLFIKCEQSIVSHCDQTVIRDSWITNSVNMRKKAVIVNGHGAMTVDNLMGIPLCNGDQQRWIDNYGHLFVVNTRFGGEGGGFTPVYNFRRYRVVGCPMGVVIQRCWLHAGSSGEAACVVYCVEVPNIISLQDCCGGTTAVRVKKDIDLKNYFYVPRELLKFKADNVGLNSNSIPEELQNPVVHAPKVPDMLTPEKLQELSAKAQPLGEVVPAAFDLQKEGNAVWEITGCMDGGIYPNSCFLHLFRTQDRYAIMRRTAGARGKIGSWPHVTISKVKVDLKKYPVFVVDPVSTDVAEYAVKIMIPGQKKVFAVHHRQTPLNHFELNLAERFPELLKYQEFYLKFYYVPFHHIQPKKNKPGQSRFTPAGGTIWFKTIGFNPEKSK